MASTCDCIKFSVNCVDPSTPIEIYLNLLGIVNGKGFYVGNFSGNSYCLVWRSTVWSLENIITPNVPLFYAQQGATTPCEIYDYNWTAGTQTFCDIFGPNPIATIEDLTGDDDPNCGNIFSGECSCKLLTIPPNSKIKTSSTIFYKTCDGISVQQTIGVDDVIIGCFSGTPISSPSNVVVQDYSASTCDYFCLTGDSCCLRLTAVTSEDQTIITTISPIGEIGGFPFFVLPISNSSNLIIRYQTNKFGNNGWIAVINKTSLTLNYSGYCPTGVWVYDNGPITQLITEEIDCPTPVPSPTPTKTPVPTPSPTPTPIVKKKFYNECEPITLFPMGVECSVTQPTNFYSPDGSILLLITGGTPPYTVVWDNNNIGQVLYNLGPGTYSATVVDYYGDFTAVTNCVLTGETPSPSPTPTPTPTTPYEVPSLCVTITIENKTTKLTFAPSGLKNNKPYWSNGSFEIYWDNTQNKWFITGLIPPPNSIQNNNPTIPPLSSWVILGPYASFTTITVIEGTCEPMMLSLPLVNPQPLSMNVSTNNTVCGCEGSITMIGSGGYPPYMYSINSGVTFRNIPFFTNLCSGTYTPLLMDSSGQTISQTVILNKPSDPITYLVKTNTSYGTNTNDGTVLSKTYTTTISVSPPLEDGVVLIFDFIHSNTHRTSIQTGSSVNVSSTILYKNSSPITEDGTNSSTGTTTNIIPGCQDKLVYVNSNSEEWYSLQMINSDNYEIITNTSITKIDENPCYIGTSNEQYTIMNLRLSGCSCCNVFKI